MAILNGINTKMRGSVGKYTFRQQKGQTIVSEKITPSENPKRTEKQMRIRAQWANLVAFWQSFTGNLKPSFQSKLRTRSDFNEFMSSNLGMNPVYLTADEARNGACVVAPYQVTRGSLDSINVEIGENGAITNIQMGGMTIGASTTIKTFSEAIIDHNPAWRHGDQISFFVSKQTQDPATGIPRVATECLEITLDKFDELTLLGDIIPANFLTVEDGRLKFGGAVNGGVAAVHSRLVNSKTYVSTQFMVVQNSLLPRYSGEEQMTAAINSFGTLAAQDFLTPNVDTLTSVEP